MLRVYWDTEGELFGKELPMDPDLDSVMFLHRLGRLQILTARRDGLLVGLNGFNCGGTLFRKSTMCAVGLILYLLPAERRGLAGLRFLKRTDDGLRARGIKLVIYSPSSRVDISPLLLRLGYKRLGATFEKML